MKCEEFRNDFLVGDLTEDHFAHLSSCRSCQREQPALSWAARSLNEVEFWQAPPEGLVDRTVATVTAAAVTPRPRRTSRMRWLVAAGAVVILGAGGLFFRQATAPDWTVAMGATSLAPTAAGSISGWNTESGTQVRLDIAGLDPAPEGFFYELWFSSEDAHISAGTFTSADHVESWVGVRRSEYPRVWITLEELNGDPGPSRSTVLDTNIEP